MPVPRAATILHRCVSIERFTAAATCPFESHPATAARILPACIPSPIFAVSRQSTRPPAGCNAVSAGIYGGAAASWPASSARSARLPGVPDARRMSPAKVVHAVNARQARRYAERWCAARLACPRLRATRSPVLGPRLGALLLAPLTEQRQQARRLAEAGTGEVARIKQALAPRQPARPWGS